MGIGDHMSHRLCARLQIHDQMKVKELTAFQLTALTSFLSSPAAAKVPQKMPLAGINFVPPPPIKSNQQLLVEFNLEKQQAERDRLARIKEREEALLKKDKKKGRKVVSRSPTSPAAKAKTSSDPLSELQIESELRRAVRENILHQRLIGSYVGKRHSMHLPVRGQNTQSNAKTARKLNRIERW